MDQLPWDDVVEIPAETLPAYPTTKVSNSADDRFRIFLRRE